MGSIRHVFEEGPARLLPEHAMVGRNQNCDVRLWDRQASAVHAALRWSNDHWQVVDLGSRNGTWVANNRLETGEAARLENDMVVSFGSSAESWVLTSSEAPTAFARGEKIDVPIVDGVLALPEVEVRLTMNVDTETWVAEYDGRCQQVDDREFFLGYRLLLPSPELPSTERNPGQTRDRLQLSGARLLVYHDSVEEYITAWILPRRAGPVDLGHRTHHQLLLELARIRLKHRAQGLSASQSGWVFRDDVARRLGSSVANVNLLIYRARDQLEELGFPDAKDIVERQPRTGMLRVGLEDVQILPTSRP